MTKLFRVVALASILLVANFAHASFSLKNTIFEKVGIEQGIDPVLLYSMALTESARSHGNNTLKPSPLVIRSAKGAQYFTTKTEAVDALRQELATTNRIDIGMMQINLRHHDKHDPISLLDPYTNLTYAAQILKKTMSSTDDKVLGVGRYHSYRTERALWYGSYVWQIYRNLTELK